MATKTDGRSRSGASSRGSSSPKKGAPKGGAKQRPKGRAARKQAKQKERMAKLRSRAGSRWRYHYDIEGPRVRLGVLWFLATIAAFAVGLVAVTVLFGVAFAAASAHTLRTWRAAGRDVDPTVALGMTAVVVALAAVGPRFLGVGMFVLVGLAGAMTLRGDDGTAVPSLGSIGLLLQCTLPTALAGGAVLLLADREIWSAIALVIIVSAYESGDYLIGSGAANAAEGPLAGLAAVLVASMVVAAGGFPPFSVGEAMLFGLAVAPLALAGQYLATAMLPHARSFAPALRRVDSLLLAAPVWYFGLDVIVW